MRRLLLTLCISLVFVSGCWDQLIIEELAMAISMGIDVNPEEPELFYMTITNPALSETSVEQTKKIVEKGYSLSNAFFNMQKQRDRFLVLGQVATMVFSEEAAKSGLLHQIMREVDQLRDMNPNANIVVVRGAKAQEVLYLEPTEEARVAKYLNNLLNRNFNSGIVPRITASRYWFRHSTEGVDPVVPVIELVGSGDKKTGLIITGLAALDSAGKMQGTLNDQEILHFLILSGQIRRGRMTTKLPIEGELRDTSMFINKVKRKISTTIANGRPKISIRLEVDIDIINIKWGVNVVEEEAELVIGQALARDIQGNALDMIKRTQGWGTDILGLGQYVRIQHPNWFKEKEKEWGSEYKNSDITLEVKTNVSRTGTLVNPQY